MISRRPADGLLGDANNDGEFEFRNSGGPPNIFHYLL
jgi:hypothetical protein